MDLGISALTAAYPQTSGYPQSRAGNAEARDFSSTLHDNARSARTPERVENLRAARPANDEDERKQVPATEASRAPGFQFEYEDSRQVMKVLNGKGVLIYQVPSKGQLALIEAADQAADPGRALSLTA